METVNKYGNTPLHMAATRGYINIVGHILEWIKGHPDNTYLINIQNNNGHTPAHQAARKGYKETYNLLASAGADLTIKCKKHEKTPAEELKEEPEEEQLKASS